MSKVTKHETLEAGEILGTAEEITEALKIQNPVDQMIALQELGLEVIPVQGGKTVEKPWTVPKEDTEYAKSPGRRPMTPDEWEAYDAAEAERVGEDAPLTRRKSRNKNTGYPYRWKNYGKDNPLEFYATEEILDHLEKEYHGAGVIFQDGLIGIDADTPEEVQYLEEWIIEHCSSRTLISRIKTSGIPFTVRTPGKVALGEDGNPDWKHSEGGHLWIRMPDGWSDSLPDHAKGKLEIKKSDGFKFDVKRQGGGYFVTPGSTRVEGPYVLVGEVLDAEPFPGLVAAIQKAFTPEPKPTPKPLSPRAFTPGVVSGMTTGQRLEEWSENRSWSSIFNDLGWAHSSICSGDCFEFTHPDSSSGSHSGVAHGLHCPNGPVPDAITIYSSTAQAATGIDSVAKKYRFVLEVLHKGDTNSFFQTEPVREETLKKTHETPTPSKGTLTSTPTPSKGTLTPTPTPTPETLEETQKEEGTVTMSVKSEEEVIPKDTQKSLTEQAKALEAEAEAKSHQALLDAARLIMEVRFVRPGVFSYLPITEQGVVAVDQGEDWAINKIRNARKGIIPATETKAKSILSTFHDEASEAVSHMGMSRADETPRFWSEATGDDLTSPSYIYRGRSDWGRTPPFYVISSEGYEESAGGEAAAVFLEREDFADLDVDLNSTVKDLDDLWTFINIPEKSRAMVLGSLITSWISPKATRPIIFVTGATSTGKTLTTERLAALIDPKTGGETTVSTKGNGSAIGQAGLGNETVVIGNISSISRQSSDALAQLGGSSTKVERTLYKNGRNSAFVIRSTAIISTKETGMTLQDDLLNRLIPVLPGALTMEQKRRGTQSQAWKEALPRLRGALMALAVEVKRDAVENPDREFSRDYRWQTVGNVIERVEVVLRENGMTVKQPWAEVLKEELHSLKGDSLPPIIEWIRDELDEEIEGRPGVVLDELVSLAGGQGSPSVAGWIQQPRGLVTLLEQYTGILEEEGVNVSITIPYEGRREKKITITPTRDSLYETERVL